MYNSKHPRTWDESTPYVQHSYNKALHSSTNYSPFQLGLGFQLLGPIDVALPLATTQVESSHVHSEADKATRFIEWIEHIHQQVHEILQKANAKYKQNHDQHRVSHQFQVGDNFLLHFKKSALQGPIESSTHFVMGLTLSPSLWVAMLLSSTLQPSLACIQCSMWTSFGHIFHHYWTPQRSQNS
jgi:hypothetical protein